MAAAKYGSHHYVGRHGAYCYSGLFCWHWDWPIGDWGAFDYRLNNGGKGVITNAII